MGWVKDVHQQLATRPPSAAPVAIRWEHEHGGTVNVLMIATALEDADEAALATLDGWRIEACGVLVSRLEEAAGDYAVGLFTSAFQDASRRVNADLLHFGRAHCEVLLAGEPVVWASSSDDLVPAVHDTLVGWVEDGRIVGAARGSVRRRLADQSLAGAVVDGAASAEPAEEVARRIWGNVAPWPGPEWTRIPASQ